MKRIAGLLLLGALALQGCAPVLIGAVAYNSAKHRDQKVEFLSRLNQTNAEREKAGLKPLDRCVEIYHYDTGWAEDLPECRACVDSLRKLYGQKPRHERRPY